jgi:hypothetical protein
MNLRLYVLKPFLQHLYLQYDERQFRIDNIKHVMISFFWAQGCQIQVRVGIRHVLT